MLQIRRRECGASVQVMKLIEWNLETAASISNNDETTKQSALGTFLFFFGSKTFHSEAWFRLFCSNCKIDKIYCKIVTGWFATVELLYRIKNRTSQLCVVASKHMIVALTFCAIFLSTQMKWLGRSYGCLLYDCLINAMKIISDNKAQWYTCFCLEALNSHTMVKTTKLMASNELMVKVNNLIYLPTDKKPKWMLPSPNCAWAKH